MKKSLLVFAIAFSFMTFAAYGQVILQEDFTSSDVGTLPSTLDAEWDPNVDVIVVTTATAGVTDHTGGDGHVLQVADIGAAGYNFCFPISYQTDAEADCAVEALAYIDFGTATGERDYGLFLRTGPDAGGGVYPAREGYWLFVTANSSWGSYVPTNGHAFILKRSGGAWVQIGSEGATEYADGWHTLRLEAEGTEIRGYVDGNLEVTGTDSEYTDGTAGIVFYEVTDVNYAGIFDNFLWTNDFYTSVENWDLMQ